MEKLDFPDLDAEIKELEKIPIDIRRYIVSYVDNRMEMFILNLPEKIREEIINNWKSGT